MAFTALYLPLWNIRSPDETCASSNYFMRKPLQSHNMKDCLIFDKSYCPLIYPSPTDLQSRISIAAVGLFVSVFFPYGTLSLKVHNVEFFYVRFSTLLHLSLY